MKVNLHTPVEEVQIQIIPLIDVIFCILTFFLLAALQFTRQEEISINLPKSTTGTPSTTAGANAQAQRQILTLTIDAIGQTYVENDPVKREQLKEAFKRYLQQTPNAILALKVSQTATYNDVIGMIDMWRQEGGDRISFVTTPSFSNQSTSGSESETSPLPNTSPITPINPQTNPNFNLPPAPNPLQNNQGVTPVDPGTSPVLPKAPSGQTNPTPRR
ncbi:MAG: biopolymer transporter ExbD [Iphinoe sp. HA4291-MV1]|jgi:biopolymer transport protein ExbD|nr:biopolymer transporter ExbD [Iphinoe sp. HA4291-MV1]